MTFVPRMMWPVVVALLVCSMTHGAVALEQTSPATEHDVPELEIGENPACGHSAQYEKVWASAAEPGIETEERIGRLECAALRARSRGEYLQALLALAEALETSGDTERATEARREVAALEGPLGGRPVLFSVQGAALIPLAYAGVTPEPIFAGGSATQRDTTRFAARYLAKGRRYRFLGAGMEGAAVVTDDPSYTVSDGCSEELAAAVRVEVGGDVKPGARGLATTRALRSIAPRTRRKLTEGERRELVALAVGKVRGFIEEAPGNISGFQPAPCRFPSIWVDSFAQDLDGDGKAEWVGVTRLQKGADTGAKHVLLVVRPATPVRGARVLLRAERGQADGPADGEGMVHWIHLLGTVDLDVDGIDDIVTSTSYYEWWTQETWLSRRNYEPLAVSGGGC